MTTITRPLLLHSLIKTCILVLALSLSAPTYSANISWTVVITPSGSGTIAWATTIPVQSGVLTKSAKLTFAEGSYVDLTFQVNEGFKLERVMKQLNDETPYLDANKHGRYGPVSKNHTILAIYSQINPTGELKFESPAVLPEGVAPVYDATGHYSGTLPIGSHRKFDAYTAMDESGKLDVLPNISTLEGYTSDPANKAVSGVVKTIDNKPQVSVSGKLAGTRDGVPGEISGSGSLGGIEATPTAAPLSGPQALAIESSPAEQVLNADAVAGYKVLIKDKQTGIKLPLKEKALPVSLPVSTNATREWSINVSLLQKTDAKQKTKVYAKALLKLPNGDQVNFAERVVKYSRKTGYTLAFTKGTNLTSSKVDKKTSLSIKKMLFACPTSTCTLTGGEMQYSFLGQKGKANLLDFLTPL